MHLLTPNPRPMDAFCRDTTNLGHRDAWPPYPPPPFLDPENPIRCPHTKLSLPHIRRSGLAFGSAFSLDPADLPGFAPTLTRRPLRWR